MVIIMIWICGEGRAASAEPQVVPPPPGAGPRELTGTGRLLAPAGPPAVHCYCCLPAAGTRMGAQAACTEHWGSDGRAGGVH